MNSNKIGYLQLASILLVCRISEVLIYIKDEPQGAGGYNAILAVIISTVLNFVAVLPIYYLSVQNGGSSLVESIKKQTPKIGSAVSMFYLLVLLLLSAVNTNQSTLAIDELYIEPKHTFLLLLLAVVSVLYCANKGAEGLGRTAFILSIIIFIVIFFIFLLNIPQYINSVLEPVFAGGYKIIFQTPFLKLSGYFESLIFAILLSEVKNKRLKSFTIYSSVSLFLSILVIFTVSSVYGIYARYETFPFFTSIGLSDSGILRRTDSLYICLWVTLSLVKSAAFVLCAINVLKRLKPNISKKKSIALCAVITGVVCFVLNSSALKTEYIINERFMFVLYVISVVFIPLIYILISITRRRRNDEV